jgi:L-lactate dehydrogenase complex protein LldG
MGAATSMSDGRFNVMAAVAQRLRAGVLPPAGQLEHPGNPSFPSSALSTDELIVQFTREAEALTVVVHRVKEDGAAIAHVSEIVADRGATRVLAWDEKWLNCRGLGSALTAAGTVVESCWLPREGAERRERLAQLDDVTIGLTGAVAGLADTGSLALVSGPGRGRIASLLPPLHVAVLRVEQLYPTYAAFLAALPQIENTGSNLVLVTGPSRTADIEMTLTRGVHGPGEVHVVLIG